MSVNATPSTFREALVLYGPPGVEDLGRGFEAAFNIDSQSRIDHHGTGVFEPAARPVCTRLVLVPNRDESALVYKEDGVDGRRISSHK